MDKAQLGAVRDFTATGNDGIGHAQLGAVGHPIRAHRTRSRFSFGNRLTLRPLRQACWLRELRQLREVYGGSELVHACFQHPISGLVGDGRRIGLGNCLDSRHLAALGSPRERGASGALRHHHGHLFRGQVSAGLFGVLCVGRGLVTCPVRGPQTRT